jgi:hypothetical protein
MEITESYHFHPSDFNLQGRRMSDKETFRSVLKTWERDFHQSHSEYYAEYMYANRRTMLLLQHSCDADPRMLYGMDYFGEFDPSISIKMEMAGMKNDSETIVVYGIDSAYMSINGYVARFDEDKGNYPLTLLTDNELPDGVVKLMCPDDDDDDFEEELLPIDFEFLTR